VIILILLFLLLENRSFKSTFSVSPGSWNVRPGPLALQANTTKSLLHVAVKSGRVIKSSRVVKALVTASMALSGGKTLPELNSALLPVNITGSGFVQSPIYDPNPLPIFRSK
jgi:hypothetical protein